MAHDLCEDLELVADDGGGFDDYYWDDDDFHFHDDDGFSASPTTPGSGGAPGQQQQQQQMGDISASDYKEGEDMQGIPWERLNYTRDQYRRMRLKEYKSYKNLTRSHSGLQQQVIIYIYIYIYIYPCRIFFYFCERKSLVTLPSSDRRPKREHENVIPDTFVFFLFMEGMQTGGEEGHILRFPSEHESRQVNDSAFPGTVSTRYFSIHTPDQDVFRARMSSAV
jgi:hypothetical protein